ncbi:hypothetical protein [Gilvimarinus agarilyticus]|uniref:hypothetical protein n=1 Tax=Gilvimarinus agarilyticus TaxID=679259 RepID=UPI0012FCFFC2|nr:hypothetical protein [Gilvimarinus agarilyticus]
MKFIKTSRWLFLTLLLFPVAALLYGLARLFESIGEHCQCLFDRLVEKKHEIAPPPPFRTDEELQAIANEDL